jgi:hypothetical protein
MFDIEHAKATLQHRINEIDAQVATRLNEIKLGMFVQRELDALMEQRNDLYRRLAAHGKPATPPEPDAAS